MDKVVTSDDIASALFSTATARDAELSQHQLNSFAETVKIYDGGRSIISAAVYANSNDLNPEAFPTGQVIHYAESALVDPMTLTPDSLEFMVLCPIASSSKDKERLTDKYFHDRLEALDSVPQYSDAPIHAGIRDYPLCVDSEHWAAEMGQRGAVGVLKKAKNVRTDDYFIMAKSTAPLLGQQFIDYVTKAKADGHPLTWRQAVDSKEFKYWQNGVSRQTCRLACSAAEKLKVGISTVFEDATFMEYDDQAPYMTASSYIHQWISSISVADVTAGDGRVVPSVAQYSQCAPVSKTMDAVHYVAVSPWEGFVSVRLQDGFQPASGALPTTTGRVVPATKVDVSTIADEEEHSHATVADIRSQYIWEGKMADSPINDRLHPNAYRRFEAIAESSFVRQGWQASCKVEPMKAVIMKVAARKSRPPK